MKSMSGLAVMAACRPACATEASHLVVTSIGFLEQIGVGIDHIVEALLASNGIRVTQVADHDEGFHLAAEFLGFVGHVFDGRLGDLLVVGDHGQGIAIFALGRAVEDTDRDIGFVGFGDQFQSDRAIDRDDHDAINLLGDAVLDLLELLVGVCAGVDFNDLIALGFRVSVMAL